MISLTQIHPVTRYDLIRGLRRIEGQAIAAREWFGAPEAYELATLIAVLEDVQREAIRLRRLINEQSR